MGVFIDSANCIDGEEHDWSEWVDHYDCTHAGDDHTDCNPSGGERVCSKCGMGAMHYSLWTDEN